MALTVKEIVEAIGIDNIKLTDTGFSVSVPRTRSAWFTKNTDTIKANKAAIIDYVAAEQARINAERARAKAENEARWAAERAAQDAEDKPLLDAMHARIAELKAQIPADCIEVAAVVVGDADGDKIYDYIADGVKLSWRDVTIVGSACAVRPGCLGAFAEERVVCISRAKLEEIRAAQGIAKAEKAEKKAAREKELTETAIPEDAIEAYKRYHGDADKAWEREDEAAWAIIRKWTPYIEAQRGMDKRKMLGLVKAASAEANYGIAD